MEVRASQEEEMQGLDMCEHGIQTYLSRPLPASAQLTNGEIRRLHCEGRGLWPPAAFLFLRPRKPPNRPIWMGRFWGARPAFSGRRKGVSGRWISAIRPISPPRFRGLS